MSTRSLPDGVAAVNGCACPYNVPSAFLDAPSEPIEELDAIALAEAFLRDTAMLPDVPPVRRARRSAVRLAAIATGAAQ